MVTPVLPHRDSRREQREGFDHGTRVALAEDDLDKLETKIVVGLQGVDTKLKGVNDKQDKMIKLLTGGLLTFAIAAILLAANLAFL